MMNDRISLRTLAKLSLLCSIGTYFLVLAYFYIFQDSFIFHPTAATPSTPPPHFRDIYIDSSLHAWLSEPPSEDAPLLLYCHGNGADLSRLKNAAKIFYSFGFQTLMFEYRGYGNSAYSNISERSVLEDALNAYQFLKEKSPSKKIFVWGHSLGSSVAAYVAMKQHPNGVILEGTFPDIIDAGKFHYPYLIYFESLIKSTFKTKDFLQITTPKLFIHGSSDEIVPLSLGLKTFELSQPPKIFLTVPAMGHTDFPSLAEKYRDNILEFVSASS